MGNEIDLSRVPAESRPILTTVHEELERALTGMIVPLPNKQVSPGESWKAERSLLIPSFGRAVTARLDMTYTYLGIRGQGGQEEAVLDLKGEFRVPSLASAAAGGDAKAQGEQTEHGTGRAEGVAGVDLASGQVTQADMVLIFDADTNPLSRPLPSGGRLTLRLRREAR